MENKLNTLDYWKRAIPEMLIVVLCGTLVYEPKYMKWLFDTLPILNYIIAIAFLGVMIFAITHEIKKLGFIDFVKEYVVPMVIKIILVIVIILTYRYFS